MKVITVCGSLRFQREMEEIALKLELEENCVLLPIFPIHGDKDAYTEEKMAVLGKMHFERIKISDAILVVNVDNYIGASTQKEIEFARSLNKEILYYTDLVQ